MTMLFVRPTVLIVDDHRAFRAAATVMLEGEGFDVVGEAPDGLAALEAGERLRPSVVLLDVQLPGIDGIEVAERLARGVDPPRSCWSRGLDVRRTGDAHGPPAHSSVGGPDASPTRAGGPGRGGAVPGQRR